MNARLALIFACLTLPQVQAQATELVNVKKMELIQLVDPEVEPHNLPKNSFIEDLEWPMVFYGTMILSLAGLIIFVFWERGLKTIVPVISYVGALSTMTILLRSVFAVQGFNYPRFVTSCHFVGTAAVTGGLLLNEKRMGNHVTVIDKPTFVKAVGPSAVFFALSLGLSNLGIALTNAHFYEMVESSTFLSTAAVACMMGKKIHMLLWLPLMLSFIGFSLTWTGEESKFSVMGFVFLLLAAWLRSGKTMVNQMVMSAGNADMQTLQPTELTFYNAATCFFIMMPWALMTEGLAPFSEILSFGTASAVLITVVNALVINLSNAYVIREIGGVAAQLTGTVKSSLSCVGAWATLGEVISMRQVIGYAVVLACITGYNKLDKHLQDEQKRLAEKEPLVKDKEAAKV